MTIKSALCLSLTVGAFIALPLMLSACDDMQTYNDDDSQVQAAQPIAPQPPVEVIPVIQDPQAEIWRPGYWKLVGGVFTWIPGEVIPRPAPTAVWASAHWVRHIFGWSFEEGHWE